MRYQVSPQNCAGSSRAMTLSKPGLLDVGQSSYALGNIDLSFTTVSIRKLCEGCSLSVSNIIDLSLMARCVDNARWTSGGPDGLPALVTAYADRSYPDESSALAGLTWADINWEAALTEDLMSCKSCSAVPPAFFSSLWQTSQTRHTVGGTCTPSLRGCGRH